MTRRQMFASASVALFALLLATLSTPNPHPLAVYVTTSALLLVLGFWGIDEGEWPTEDDLA